MLIKSKVVDGLVIGKIIGNCKGDDSYLSKVSEIINNSMVNFSYDFKLNNNSVSILPILMYYSQYSEEAHMEREMMECYAINKFKNACKDKNYTSKDLFSLYSLMSDLNEEIFDELIYSLNLVTNVHLVAKYICSLKTLNTSNKLKDISEIDIYGKTCAATLCVDNINMRKGIIQSILCLAYSIEAMLINNRCDSDFKLCEFMYICLRSYIEEKFKDTVEFAIDLTATLDDYNGLYDSCLDGISSVYIPVKNKDYVELGDTAMQLGSMVVYKYVSNIVYRNTIIVSEDIIKNIESEKDNAIKDYKFKNKAKDKEIKDIRAELKAKDKEVKYLTKKIDKLENNDNIIYYKNKSSELEAMVKKLEGKLEQRGVRITTLEDKLSNIEDKLSKIETHSDNDSSAIDVETSVVEEEVNSVTFNEKVSAIKDKRYVLIGGNNSLERGLKKLLPNITFKKDSLNYQISSKVDYMLLYTKNIGHSNTYKANTFSSSLKGVIPLYNSNIVKVVDSIYTHINKDNIIAE